MAQFDSYGREMGEREELTSDNPSSINSRKIEN